MITQSYCSKWKETEPGSEGRAQAGLRGGCCPSPARPCMQRQAWHTRTSTTKPFFFLLIFFPGSFFSRLRFWLFPPLTFWFRSSVGSRSTSKCSSLSAQSPDPARASPQTVNLPLPGNKHRTPALQNDLCKGQKPKPTRSDRVGPRRSHVYFC